MRYPGDDAVLDQLDQPHDSPVHRMDCTEEAL